MTTRADIRAAFKRHGPLSLTELAVHCPSCENDRQVVASAIATLRAEGKVKNFGLDAANKPVYSIDRWPEETESTAAERAPDRAPTPVTTPSPARPAVTPEEPTMTVRDKIEAALKKHGPMTVTALREHVNDEHLSPQCGSLAQREVLLKLGGVHGATIYGLPSQTLKDAKQDAPPQQRAEKPAPKPTTPKGRGHLAGRGAVTRNGEAPAADRTSPAPQTSNGAAFAINDYGEIGIHRGNEVMKLDAAEFARLRAFIERTEPVWQDGK